MKSENKNPYFQKDEKGRDIYYLWGNAGDAYYINKMDRVIIDVSYFCMIIISILFYFLLGIILPSTYPISAFIISLNSSFLLWFAFFYFYQKNMSAAELHKSSSMVTQRPCVKTWYVAGAFQILFISSNYLMGGSDVYIVVSAIFVIIFYPFLIWFIRHRRGYIFQNRTVTEE